MNFPVLTLINRTGKQVEWMCGGKIYQMEPNEVRTFSDKEERFAAHHALEYVNTRLEIYTPEIEAEEIKKGTKTMPDYGKLPWPSLTKRVGKDFKPGMMKEQLIQILEDRWQEKYGSLQKGKAKTKKGN